MFTARFSATEDCKCKEKGRGGGGRGESSGGVKTRPVVKLLQDLTYKS